MKKKKIIILATILIAIVVGVIFFLGRENTFISQFKGASNNNFSTEIPAGTVQIITLEADNNNRTPTREIYVLNGAAYLDIMCEKPVSSITVPTKEGYKFTGYYDDDNRLIVNVDGTLSNSNIKDKYDTSTDDYKATAHWEKVQKIILDKNGGNEGTTNLYVSNGLIYSDMNCTKTIKVIDLPTQRGYKFMGYTYKEETLINASGEINKELILEIYNRRPDENYTMTAQWKKVQVIQLKKEEREDAIEYIYILSGLIYSDSNCLNETETVQVPVKDGYRFQGYKYNNFDVAIDERGVIIKREIQDIINSGEDYTMIAQWEKTQKISIDNDGGIGDIEYFYVSYGNAYSDPNCFERINNIEIPTRDRGRYKFAGYKNEKGITIISETGAINRNILAAVWDENQEDYTITAQWEIKQCGQVTLKPNDKTGRPYVYIGSDYNLYLDSDCTNKMTSTENPIVPPKEDGKVFKGYGFGEQGMLIIDKNGYAHDNIESILEQSGIRELTAQWEDSESYLATIQPNGETITGKEGETINIVSYVKRPKLTFNYNYNSKTSSVTPGSDIKCTAGNIDIKSDKEVMYTFGKSDATVTITINSITLETPENREGYEFEGWYTEKDGGSKVGDAGDVYSITDSTTIYAHWKKSDSGDNGSSDNNGGNSGDNGSSDNNGGNSGDNGSSDNNGGNSGDNGSSDNNGSNSGNNGNSNNNGGSINNNLTNQISGSSTKSGDSTTTNNVLPKTGSIALAILAVLILMIGIFSAVQYKKINIK